MIAEIRDCFGAGKIYYSRHARDEMENDEFGEILDREVYEAVLSGKVIENYPDDFPYPSCLIYGRTRKGRPFMWYAHILPLNCLGLSLPYTNQTLRNGSIF